MNRLTNFAVMLAFAAIIATGCAGSENPVTASEQNELNPELSPAEQSPTVLWGYYDVIFDFDSETVEVMPCRTVDYTMNIVTFLNNNPLGIEVDINGQSSGSDYLQVNLDVTINHPMDDTGFNSYDVRGIFIGSGSGAMKYNFDLKYPVSGSNQILIHDDGYSRWYNPSEFSSPLIWQEQWKYDYGILATPGYTGTATLNPYKYFAEGLTATGSLWNYLTSDVPDAGCFLAGTSNTRNYVIRFPKKLISVDTRFNYAVTSNWTGTAPQNHPSHAPEAVGFKIADNSAIYYINSTDNGGYLDLTFSLYSWKPTPSMIYIESTVLDVVEWLDPDDILIGDGDDYKTYHVEIPVDNVTGIEGQELWVIAEYEDYDYDNNYKSFPNRAMGDPLIAAFRRGLTVLDYNPMWMMVVSPNGGEEIACGNSNVIEWASYCVPGTVNIEYSTDDFVSDIRTIATDEENDGTYTWYPVPCNFSDTVKIRITSLGYPDVWDVSDDYFIIFDDGTNFGWAKIWGGDADEIRSRDVATDSEGNAYVTGGFEGEVEFNPEGGDLCTSYSADHAYLCKYDTIGNLEWVRTWGGNFLACGYGVSVDGFGNVYVCGPFYGTVDFDPGPDADYHPSNNNYNFFLSKFDPDGEFLWAQTWGGSTVFYWSGDYCDIATTDAGYTFFNYSFYYIFDGDPDGGDLHESCGSTDSFLSCFEPDGKFLWARTWGGTGADSCFGVTTDGNDDIYITGYYTGSVDFNPGSGVNIHSSNGQSDVFLSKFGMFGDWLWTRTWGSEGYDRGKSVAADNVGNVYTVGKYWEQCDFDPGPGLYIPAMQENTFWAFLSKLDSDGNFQWARVWDGYPALDITLNESFEYVYVIGKFEGTKDLDPGTGTDYHTANGYQDVYLSKLYSDGSFTWALTWGGLSNELAYEVDVDTSGNIFTTGYFSGTVDFAPTDPPCNNLSFERTAIGYSDVFLMKHLSTGCW